MTHRQHVVDVPTLIAELNNPDPPTLLDVRWALGGGGVAAYQAGHLPGAAFLDLDAHLAGPPGPGGRHPLPHPDAVQAALRRVGVRARHSVVVYDAGGNPPTGAAARAWWIMRWAGLAAVRVLNGGYATWLKAGAPVSVAHVGPARGDVTVTPGSMPVVDAAGALAVATDGVLLDARVPARFHGEVEPIDPVAGHIPGAVNQPAAETVDDDGRLRAPEQLRAQFEDLGVRAGRPVAAYCGSGITAAQTALALAVAGFEPALYIGSWSHWITDPTRPVATGE